MNIGVIGYGYWGPNFVRNLMELEGAQVKWCADTRAERLALVQRRYPSIRVTTESEDAIADADVEAIVIATPVLTHHSLAKRALEAGKHVLVEKPMAATVKEAEELLNLAEGKGLVLMVDHTFIYTGAVRRMKELIDVGELGELHYLDSVRVNLGVFQKDVDVIWDLAPHDLAILSYLVRETPRAVAATGTDHTGSGLSDVAYVTVHFPGNFLAHFHVNWLSPVKIRQMLVGGSRRMLVYNDMEPTEKVRVYDRGIRITNRESIYKMLVDYRTGDMWAPKLDNREALALECEHFLECARLKKMPLSSAASGLQVVRMLEAASLSLASGGSRIPL